jgi:serine protease Do
MKRRLAGRLGGWICSLAVVLTAVATTARAASTAPAPVTAVGGDHPEALAKVFPAIVRIEAIRLEPSDGRLMKAWVGGSGVIISAQGHVLTNCHVAEDADFYRCYLYDGQRIEAHRIGLDALTDLAVLQLDLSQRAKDAPPLPVAAFGNSDRLAAGDTVFALGSPGFLSQSVTRGIVANPSLVLPEQTAGKMILKGEDVGTLVRWILHDASIFGGNSGGPLVNDRGEVVGINEIGVFNLSGAIPGNLARGVADQLILHGRVTRGWSGLTVQPRLEASGPGGGVVVADAAPGSPAKLAGLVPGDIILACDGHAIEGAEEKAVAHFNRLETGRLPGNEFVVDYERGGQRHTVKLTLTTREPAEADDVELAQWGAVLRDVTPDLARDERLPDNQGVWVENIRPAGPIGQAEPELRRQDVIVGVDGTPVGDVAGLRALTEKLMKDAPNGLRTVLASVRRDGAVISSVVELRAKDPGHDVTPQARKAWLGAASQPLTPKLGTRLGIKADGGARLTRIYPGTKAEAAGLRVGDIVLALDGSPVTARRQEDADAFARQIRQYKAGTEAVFSLWRDGQKLDVPVTLEQQPVPAAEMPYWKDEALEYEVRDLAFDDHVRLQLPPEATGVLVATVDRAGWAALAGLHGDDLVLEAGDKHVATVAELRSAREEAVRAGQAWWVLLVQRRGQTLFVEINLKPARAKS